MSETLSFEIGDAELVPFDIKAAEGVDPADLPTIAGASYLFTVTDPLDLVGGGAGATVFTKANPLPGIDVLGTANEGALATIHVNILTSNTSGVVVVGAYHFSLKVTWVSGRVNTVCKGDYIILAC